MKKVVSCILCICIVFSALLLPVSASDDNAPEALSIVSEFEKFTGNMVSLIVRFFNMLTGKDEANISTAEAKAPSWQEFNDDNFVTNPEQVLSAKTWVTVELTFESDKSYANAFNDAQLDLLLCGNGRLYTIPGFWNGGNEWKVRFVCPEAGEWYYKTVCSDKENTSLNDRTGKVVCVEYDGELEIYKHGFVSADSGYKYLTYADGTPFFWLGDTHWSLGDETVDMVKTICEKRVSQGFTVFQSEPIGATFDVTNGITHDDMQGFADYDEKFAIIAQNGLVHANAQFFFPYFMQVLIENNGGYSDEIIADGMHDIAAEAKEYLEKISRYWVARYGAYPVVWTLGQEVDRDFYWNDESHPEWNYINNPYKLVAEYIEKYDAYDHPITAHQENASGTNAYGDGKDASDDCKVYNKKAKTSAFRDVAAHNFYAAQWQPSKTEQSNFKIEKDFWFNSQGKPVINYEGQYCYLWTKNFGARMQGWTAFLNGMYGYGWGGHDTWSYLNTFDEENDSSDGVDTITSEEKINATWEDSLEYASSYQVGYMKQFFEKTEWYNLIPRFNNMAYFTPCMGVYYTCASNKDNTEMVIYFYSFSDKTVAEKANSIFAGKKTGTVGNLVPDAEYTYQWFDPINGEFSEEYSFTASSFGTYFIGNKPAATDMALLIKKA